MPQIDEPPENEFPKKRKRIARLPPSPEQVAATREAQSQWMKQQFERMDQDHRARVEALKVQPEHPSPFCAKLVKKWAGLGLDERMIATLLCMAPDTLLKHYREDFAMGEAEITAMVAGNMFRIATSEFDPNAAKVGIKWLERRGGAGWETKKVDRPDSQDVIRTLDSSKLTSEQREQLKVIMQALARPDDNEAGEDLGASPGP